MELVSEVFLHQMIPSWRGASGTVGVCLCHLKNNFSSSVTVINILTMKDGGGTDQQKGGCKLIVQNMAQKTPRARLRCFCGTWYRLTYHSYAGQG